MVGFGFDDVNLDRTLHRHDLDGITTSHPVIISHTNLHSCILNSMALQLAGKSGSLIYDILNDLREYMLPVWEELVVTGIPIS